MAFIGDRERRQIGEQLKNLVNPVKLIYFTQELECEFCRETGALLKEFSELAGKVSLEVCNFQIDRERAQSLGVDKIPGTAILGEKDYGIRIYGIPAGYEFGSFLDAVMAVSQGDSGLAPDTREKLRAITQPVHLQVLVTPT